ncbi:MAG: triose-phosphate isomerase [Gammaproteobacteria bacterium]|nr:triose-phosphate isomerase [Gammaproteobacteria bacterium]
MRSKLVIGNWKMNGDQATINGLIADLSKTEVSRLSELVVCPPFLYLQQVGNSLSQSAVKLGAQNVCQFSNGAYTGEVSASMLKDLGCEYVLVGHSERRHVFGESSQQVFDKASQLIEAGLVPVVCVGETLSERESGITEKSVAEQLSFFLTEQGVAVLEKCVLAYEPVWAIGTGLSATPGQAQDVHRFMREHIGSRVAGVSARLQILYGGSVKAGNAAELFAMPDIDGGLIGGASLVAKEFLAIAEAAGSYKAT